MMGRERIAHNAMRVWHAQVDEATSIAEVVGSVQDLVASLAPADVASIPEDCRPGRIRDESDIDYWNLRLAEACQATWGTHRDAEILTEMAQFFLRASVKVSHLTEGHPPAH